MKKIGLILAIGLMSGVLLTGCMAQDEALNAKHVESATNGLDRKVTVYLPNGDVKIYEGKFKIECADSTWTFITQDNKEIKITGTAIAEEK